ncbi:MAG: ParB/RepB/Spo0J family partition protein [Clostridia bacterium]|nr:ParB/RepB/Spo0J family partition protein [Clostridia bacterium]
MSMKRANGLGRLMSDLLDDNLPEERKKGASLVRISCIEPRSNQPRKTFDRESLEVLADSIATYGVLQPIIVRENEDASGTYVIIAGERRWRASKMAGLTEIPAVIFDGDDLKAAQVAMIENIQREDLNPVEEAFGYRDLIERFGLTQDLVAKQVGKSRPAVANALRLLDLPDEVLDMLRDGTLSAGHARALLGLSDADLMVVFAEKVVQNGLSVRDTENLVRRANERAAEAVEEAAEEETTPASVMRKTQIRMLEKKSMSVLGRKVRISTSGKKRTVELYYSDDEDLTALLTALCGSEIFDENN